jgi:hypothetical protein
MMDEHDVIDLTIFGLRSMLSAACSSLSHSSSIELRAWFLKIFSRISCHMFSWESALRNGAAETLS